MSHVNYRQGFTIIELMLSMVYVSILLIAIAMTVIQISKVYNRGLTIREVNQAGSSIASELQRTISSASSFGNNNTMSSRYIKQTWGGRLCTGQYSYIWNYGYYVEKGDLSSLNKYSNSKDLIRFVKVTDIGGAYCADPSSTVDKAESAELLSVGDRNLAVHNFTVNAPISAGDAKTGQQLYDIEFTVGTNDISALNYDSGTGENSCKTPSEKGSDSEYCSINQFSVIARAGNNVE